MDNKKKLKVALVKPSLAGHKYRGIGEYTQRLHAAFKKNKEISVSLIDIKDDFANFDIIHYPYFDPFFLTLPFFKKRKTVVTVHDLIPLKFPKHFPRGLRGSIKWQIQKESLRKSDAVVTDSLASKEDIIKYTGTNEKKIHTIYLGVGEEYKIIHSREKLNAIKDKLKLPDEFIFHVGDVNYNKNIEGLIRAFNIVGKTYLSLDLVLVGDGFVNPSFQLSQIKKLIDSLNLCDRVHFVGHTSVDGLIGLYNLAKVYLQPSFTEGFGLPVLEAMACGCPVVISNISSLSEVADNAGIKIDPNDIGDIARGIIEVLSDKKKRDNVVQKGFERIRLFSWEKCAKETIEVYLKILHRPRSPLDTSEVS